MARDTFEIAVVGGGIVGLATARALQEAGRRAVVVLEAEKRLAVHQTGRNSGVIHAGLYYRPGSLKARLCVEGRERMFRYCAERGLPHSRCGKLIVAADESELPALAALEERARANGISGARRVGSEEAREFEPHAGGVAALHVPETGTTDFARVAEALAADIKAAGGEVRLGARVLGVRPGSSSVELDTEAGRVDAGFLVNCAGLQCDRVARLCGIRPPIRIVPFRGEYWSVRAPGADLVRALVYPVPDVRFPFLGVHFMRHLDGQVTAGPNALLALARHGYRRGSFSLRDAASALLWPGFWRLALGHAGTGLREFRRSLSRRLTARVLQRLIPGIRAEDLSRGSCGIRAQAVFRDGRLADDFVIEQGPRSVHVLNAPSPAATASLAIGEHIARLLPRA